MQVAIDGPASSGKSTISKLIAKKNQFLYLDTGAMYRAVTLAALRQGIGLSDAQAMLPILDKLEIRFEQAGEQQKVFLNGEDVTQAIRSLEVTRNVSEVSALRVVREKLVHLQRDIAANHSIIMDGRDIGTVVLPHAELKVFLVASVEERAKRRFKENEEKGIHLDYEKLVEEIRHRDELDSNRAESPLKKAEDAVELDTTSLTIEEVVEVVTKWIQEKR